MAMLIMFIFIMMLFFIMVLTFITMVFFSMLLCVKVFGRSKKVIDLFKP